MAQGVDQNGFCGLHSVPPSEPVLLERPAAEGLRLCPSLGLALRHRWPSLPGLQPVSEM